MLEEKGSVLLASEVVAVVKLNSGAGSYLVPGVVSFLPRPRVIVGRVVLSGDLCLLTAVCWGSVVLPRIRWSRKACLADSSAKYQSRWQGLSRDRITQEVSTLETHS
jgi:hypothetical protein